MVRKMNIETKAQNELKTVLKLASERGCTGGGIFVMHELKKRGWEYRSYISRFERASHYCGYHGCYGSGQMYKRYD